jgi:hypothetical protein
MKVREDREGRGMGERAEGFELEDCGASGGGVEAESELE